MENIIENEGTLNRRPIVRPWVVESLRNSINEHIKQLEESKLKYAEEKAKISKGYYELADYILNHYDKNSLPDKLNLAEKLKQIHNSALDETTKIIEDKLTDVIAIRRIRESIKDKRIT
jgi:iron-sulfur cluster repair protein YtfE (RIC family)